MQRQGVELDPYDLFLMITSWQSWDKLSPAELSRKGILKTALEHGALWNTLEVNRA